MSDTNNKILLIDNYDSFTYNIREYTQRLLGTGRVDIVKNDAVIVETALQYGAWIVSPGPGLPGTSGHLLQLIAKAWDKLPILGICLGHQAIAEHFGGALRRLEEVRHGHTTDIEWLGSDPINRHMPASTKVGLYHSWIVDEKTMPDELHCLATGPNGTIMAFRHKSHPVYGVQFHPESILTTHGLQLLANFLEVANLSPGGQVAIPHPI
jgi:anthranilate synthase component II